MGGRGTFAVNKKVDFTYKTIGEIEGVKVLEGINGKHGLPEESHSSMSYIKLSGDILKQYREFNSDHTPKLDIDYSIHQGKKTLHAHDYTDGVRQPARKLTIKEIKKYAKFFKGVNYDN